MADIEHFDPRTRFIKLSYARNILLLIGSFLVGWNSWVLISLPQMVGREPEKPWFILREEILKQVGQEKDADPEKSILALRNKDVKEFANYEAAARATIIAETKILEATLLEKSPPVSWRVHTGCRVFPPVDGGSLGRGFRVFVSSHLWSGNLSIWLKWPSQRNHH